jgi:hypothetical protein
MIENKEMKTNYKKVIIEIVVRDEQGNKLNCENQYGFELEGKSFDHVERAINQKISSQNTKSNFSAIAKLI